jgi:hypothetical protein
MWTPRSVAAGARGPGGPFTGTMTSLLVALAERGSFAVTRQLSAWPTSSWLTV